MCMLDFLFQLSTDVWMRLDANNFDMTSEEEYQKSVNREIIRSSSLFMLEQASTMNHKCTGCDIKTCDPNLKPYGINVSECTCG